MYQLVDKKKSWELGSRLRQAVFFASRSVFNKDSLKPIEELLEQGADINGGPEGIVTQEGYRLNYSNPIPIVIATTRGSPELVEFLLSKGANPNLKDYYVYGNGSTNCEYTPLHWAARQESIKIVNLLLYAGADVSIQNYKGMTPLEMAIGRCNIPIIEALSVSGRLNASKSKHLLHKSLRSDNYQEIMSILLKNGANVNEIDEYGYTALRYVLKNYFNFRNVEPIVKMLINTGAAFDQTDIEILSSNIDRGWGRINKDNFMVELHKFMTETLEFSDEDGESELGFIGQLFGDSQ